MKNFNNSPLIEKEIQRLVLDYLTIKKFFHWRNNSGAMVSEYKGKKRFFRFGETGSPDIFALIKGTLYGIEIKSIKGKQNENQQEYEQRFKKAGGTYILAYSLEDVINKLK
ncbi:MAG: hypothetical protein AABY22_16415 [Nanoarchaeota archaeon]